MIKRFDPLGAYPGTIPPQQVITMDIDPRFIHPATTSPTKPGWYECWRKDNGWGGEMRYRAWGNGLWWTPLPDGWLSSRNGIYQWRGPVADVSGPAPDGTNPA
jgi:hypothetical protein